MGLSKWWHFSKQCRCFKASLYGWCNAQSSRWDRLFSSILVF